MDLVETMEIAGEEREIADAYAREQIDTSNVPTVSGMSYDENVDDILYTVEMTSDDATVADRVNMHNTALKGAIDTMTAVKKKTDADISTNADGIAKLNDSLGSLNLFGNAIIGKRWNGLVDATRAQIKIKANPNETYTIKIFDNPNSLILFGFQADNDSDGTSGINGTDISTENTLKITTKSNCKYLLLNIVSSSTMTSDMVESFKAMVVKGDIEPTEYYDFSGSNGVVAKDLADIKNSIDSLKSDLTDKLKVISVSLEDVEVAGNSSTTINLPQDYIDAGYVIANILTAPDTSLSYITSSTKSFLIKNTDSSDVAFAPTATVTLLIAKVG